MSNPPSSSKYTFSQPGKSGSPKPQPAPKPSLLQPVTNLIKKIKGLL